MCGLRFSKSLLLLLQHICYYYNKFILLLLLVDRGVVTVQNSERHQHHSKNKSFWCSEVVDAQSCREPQFSETRLDRSASSDQVAEQPHFRLQDPALHLDAKQRQSHTHQACLHCQKQSGASNTRETRCGHLLRDCLGSGSKVVERKALQWMLEQTGGLQFRHIVVSTEKKEETCVIVGYGDNIYGGRSGCGMGLHLRAW